METTKIEVEINGQTWYINHDEWIKSHDFRRQIEGVKEGSISKMKNEFEKDYFFGKTKEHGND